MGNKYKCVNYQRIPSSLITIKETKMHNVRLQGYFCHDN